MDNLVPARKKTLEEVYRQGAIGLSVQPMGTLSKKTPAEPEKPKKS